MSLTTLFTQAYAPYLALGVGKLGSGAAALGWQENLADGIPWAGCDTQAARLISTGIERKLLLEGAGSLRELLAERMHALETLSQNRTVAVLHGDGDDPETAGLLAELARLLRERHMRVCIIAATQGCASDALAVAEDCAELAMRLHSQQDARDLLGAVHALLGAFSAGLSFDEAKASLTGSGPVRAFFGQGQGPHAPADALSLALSLAGAQAHANAARVAVMLTAGREMNLEEYRLLRSRFERDQESPSGVLIGVGCDPALDDEAHALVLCRAPHSANVVRLSLS